MKRQYRYALETVSCDFTLGLEARTPTDPPPVCTILRHPDVLSSSEAAARAQEASTGGQAVVLHSIDEALLVIDRSKRTATVALVEGYPTERFEALVLDWVLPYVLTVFGRMVFHATGSQVGERIVGFAGASGSGKSTLAVALSIAGSPLVADDTFVVDDRPTAPVVNPSYPGTRLRGGSIAHFDFDAVATAGVPARIESPRLTFSHDQAELGALLLIEVVDPTAAVGLRPPEPFDLAKLIEQMYLLPDEVASSAARAARLLDDGYVQVLSIPRDLDRLPEVVAVVESLAT